MNRKVIWCRGGPWRVKYGGKCGIRGFGFYIVDDIFIKSIEHNEGVKSPFELNTDTLLETENGVIINITPCRYSMEYIGPIEVNFGVVEGFDDMYGNVIYYNSDLTHQSGNGIKQDALLNISGIYNGELLSRCPHCDHTL